MNNDNLVLNYIHERVLFKEIYKTSIFLFIISVILFPISIKWSVFCTFLILGIWTMIPGFVSLFFARLVMTDVFTYILVIHYGFWIALLYIILQAGLGMYLGPGLDPMVAIRDIAALIMASLIVLVFAQGLKDNLVIGYYTFLIVGYLTYYILVFKISGNEELLIEMANLPSAIFFDFFFTGGLLKVLEGSIQGLLSGNFYSVWPMMLVIGGIIGAIHFIQKKFSNNSKNSSKIEWRYKNGI